MSQAPRPLPHILALAMLFEGGMALLAAVLGWFLHRSPVPGVVLAREHGGEQVLAVVWGVVATVPLLSVLVLFERRPFGLFRELKRLVDEMIVPLFAGCSLWEKALIAIAAGFGEEMLFRGLLQQGLADWFGPPHGLWIGLVTASLLFGTCHWLCTAYALLATVIGVYLGLLLAFSQNLLAPVTAHALYDFVALLYLTRGRTSGFPA